MRCLGPLLFVLVSALTFSPSASARSDGVASTLAPGFLTYDQLGGLPYNVTYDNRSLFINGTRVLFLSGSIHYPRSSPGTWSTVLQEAVADGLNMVEVYVFWNVHQPLQGEFNWGGRANLTQFLTLAAQYGLFVNLRIGPYVCAEWDYGGIPTWVGQLPGVQFRTLNDVWTSQVSQWVTALVAQVRQFFADMGGPIALAQIENEYWPRDGNANDTAYVAWCGQLADQMRVNVPWIMCNGASANNTINSCNGNDCAGFIESHGQSGRILIDQPALWTENEGWFQQWGNAYPDEPYNSRAPADIAFTVARWFARGGAHHNYYMWHGGNHYTGAGSGIATWYANDVNLNADTLPNEPKRSHLQKLHSVLAKYADVIISSPAQCFSPLHLLWFNFGTNSWSNGTQQLAFVYGSGDSQLIFIENQFSGMILTQYAETNLTLAGSSMLLLDSKLNTLYNSSQVDPAATARVYGNALPISDWLAWTEPLNQGGFLSDSFPYEQLNVTSDLTYYLWYSTRFESAAGTQTLSLPTQKSQAFAVFVNGQFAGDVFNTEHADGDTTLSLDIEAQAGTNALTLLAFDIGIDNGMAAGSGPKTKGLTGTVTLGGQPISGTTSSEWSMVPYLLGEVLQVYTSAGASSVNWTSAATDSAVTWLQASFTTPQPLPSPAGRSVYLLDLTGMNRGNAYLNGHRLGRYWLIEGGDSGVPSQALYHMPNDYLNPVGQPNLLTLFEQLGAPSLSKVQVLVSAMSPSTPTVLSTAEIA